jgi:hypothetical protein
VPQPLSYRVPQDFLHNPFIPELLGNFLMKVMASGNFIRDNKNNITE